MQNFISFCTFQLFQGFFLYFCSIIGKVAADHSHKWIYKEPNEQEINFLSAWHNSADSVSTYSKLKYMYIFINFPYFLFCLLFIFLFLFPTAPKNLGSSVPFWYKGKKVMTTFYNIIFQLGFLDQMVALSFVVFRL